MGSIAESDRCSIARTRNRTVAILFNQKTACRTMFGRATSRATVAAELPPPPPAAAAELQHCPHYNHQQLQHCPHCHQQQQEHCYLHQPHHWHQYWHQCPHHHFACCHPGRCHHHLHGSHGRNQAAEVRDETGGEEEDKAGEPYSTLKTHMLIL